MCVSPSLCLSISFSLNISISRCVSGWSQHHLHLPTGNWKCRPSGLTHIKRKSLQQPLLCHWSANTQVHPVPLSYSVLLCFSSRISDFFQFWSVTNSKLSNLSFQAMIRAINDIKTAGTVILQKESPGRAACTQWEKPASPRTDTPKWLLGMADNSEPHYTRLPFCNRSFQTASKYTCTDYENWMQNHI